LQKLNASFDSTPLIYFAKARKIEILLNLFNPIIDKEVYREAVERGISKGFRDALLIRDIVKSGNIRIIDVKIDVSKYLKIYRIGRGEISTIFLVKRGDADLAIIDDSYARNIAKKMGIKVHGSLFILKYAVLKKIISSEKAFKILLETVKNGFYISPEIIAFFREDLSNLQTI